jgi:probable F420-dependent oxidoreductase
MRPFRFAAQLSVARSADEWRSTARRLEDLGFSALLMPDHFGDQLAPVPALMAAAEATTDLRVGTLVFDNDYKHPLVLAKECATIDLLSNGRLELGIGAGWMNSDYEESGIEQDRIGVRIDRMVEGIAVMKGLFTGEPFSFAGEHYTVTNHRGTPAPVQRPHPPIMIGGGGKRVLSIAAREADIISVNFAMHGGTTGPDALATGTPEATAEKIGWIKAAAGDRFDDIELGVTVFVGRVTDDPGDLVERVAEGMAMTPEQGAATPHVLVGSVDHIVEELQRRREEYGFSYIAISGPAAEQFAPVVARLAGT